MIKNVNLSTNILSKLRYKMFRNLLFVCFLLFSCIQVYSQDNKIVSLKFVNEPVSSALREVGQAYKRKMIFSQDDMRGYYVEAEVKSSSVSDALQIIFKDLPFKYELSGDFIIITNTDESKKDTGEKVKTRFVFGSVKDEEDIPLIGVTVECKNRKLFAITDLEGNFSLAIPTESETLKFSYVGMNNVELIVRAGKDSQKLETVIMTENESLLDEVVITGYQVIDKRQLTSSITTIKAEDLDSRGAITIDRMLEGKAAGLMVTNLSSTPGAASKVQVRSGGTFTGSRAPLWVVDGIIYEDPVPLSAEDINSFDRVNIIGNALTGINPQDIETINILKDASATAVYGTRAANGVIVVTTKRGKKGKATVSYSGALNVVDRPRYRDLNVMNSRERVDVSREIANRNLGYPENIFTWVGYEKAMNDYRSGNISFEDFQGQVSDIEVMNTDWFDNLYRTSVVSNHNINVSGGSDNVRYYYSVGYNDNAGSERGVDLSRITARSNIDVNLKSNLSISLNMSGSIQEAKYNHSSLNSFDAAYNSSRALPFTNPDGSLFYVENKLREGGGKINTVRYNIMNEMNNSERNINNKDLNINAQLNWTIYPGVKLMGLASYRNTTNLQEEWITEKTAFIANLRTYDVVDDFIDDWVSQYATVPFGGLYSGGMNSQQSIRGQIQLNLSKTIARKHSFNLNLGYEANSNQYKGSNGWTAPGYNHSQGRSFIPLPRIDFGAISGNLNNYGYVNMIKWMTGQDSMDVYPTITDRLSNQLSGFAIFNYSFDNRYIMNFNMRSDGSNQFGQYKRYKFKPTWSVSGRWNIHNESFWKTNNPDDELALRMSYGFRGNVPSATPYMIISNYGYDSNFGEDKATMSGFPNANLTWEKTSTLNAGLNFSKFDGRLSEALDFAYSHGTDLLLSRPVSLVNGRRTQLYNGGRKRIIVTSLCLVVY